MGPFRYLVAEKSGILLTVSTSFQNPSKIVPKGFHNETHISVNVLNDQITTQLLVFQHNYYEMLCFTKIISLLTIFMHF